MTRAYWALADSNHNITQPCNAFLTSRARVIQTSPRGLTGGNHGLSNSLDESSLQIYRTPSR